MLSRERFEVLWNLHRSLAGLNYSLEVFGHKLADDNGWRDLNGLEAVRYYLMQKHGWLPAEVNAMSLDDLRFAMQTEMQGWTLPPEAVFSLDR